MATAPLPTIDLLLPGLVPSQRMDPTAAPLARLPALELLLARGDRSKVEDVTALRWLTHRFGLDAASELPAGALSLLGDGGQPSDACWLRADPVHLRLNRDQLILCGAGVFGISHSEAEAFAAALNRHFANDGMVFFPLRPERWYLRAPATPAIVTTPLAEAIGRHVDPLLPRGPDALAWHRFGNEIQMLLHDLPVNAERESRGALAVNSVWLWGAGSLPARIECPYALVVAHDPLARGLALAGDCDARLPEPDLRRLLAGAPPGDVLWYDASLDLARVYGDDAGRAAVLAELERTVFAPLLEQLKRGTVERIRIVTVAASGGVCFEATRASLWRFWRSTMALSGYARA